jgi:hypothetical protein
MTAIRPVEVGKRNNGSGPMKFGMFHELQLPRRWHQGDEQTRYQEEITGG